MLAGMTDSQTIAPWPQPDAIDDRILRGTVGPLPLRGRAEGDHLRAQRLPTGPVVEPEMKAKMLADWQLVKRARFHAAARLEQRHWLSLVTLTSVALYGGLVTVFVLIFKDSFSGHARNIFDWVAAVASWLTLTFSLTEQIKNHAGKSRELHDCARKINNLGKRLKASVIAAPHQLIPFVEAYDVIISECDPNHDEIDFKIARLQSSTPVDGLSREEMAKKAASFQRWSAFQTYAPYVLMSLAPAIAGLLAWVIVPLPTMPGQ